MRLLALMTLVTGMLSGGATAIVGIVLYATIPAFDRVAFSGLTLGLFPAVSGLSWMAVSAASLFHRRLFLAAGIPTCVLNVFAAMPCSLVLAYATESLVWVPYLVAVESLSMVALVTWIASVVLSTPPGHRPRR